MNTHDDYSSQHSPSSRRTDSEGAADDGLIRRNGVVMVPEFERCLCEHNLDSLDALFATALGERLDKPGLPTWRQRVRLTLRDPPQPPLCKGGEVWPRTLYLKRFTDPPAAARREVRRSRTGARSVAGLEWSWMRRLARDGIRCARPVAFGEDFRDSREIRSAILTEAVPGDSLERWAARWTPADRATVRALIAPLARLVARLHLNGYVHRDLYLSHVFYDPAAPPDDCLCLIDLQRMIRPTLCPRRWIVKDLAALNYSAPARLFSRTDRMRWLKLYLGAVKLDGPARRLTYRVIGKTLRIQGRETRRRLREHLE